MKQTRRAAAMVAAVMCTAFVAACGDDESPSESGAKATTSGDAVKVMLLTQEGVPFGPKPSLRPAAEAAAEAMNAAGGIAGRPVELEWCNTFSDANGAVACARRAVADKVAISLGYDLNLTASGPVFAGAGMPVLLMGANGNKDDFSQKTAFWSSATGGAAYFSMPFMLAEGGAKRIALAVNDLPINAGYTKALEPLVEASGAEYAGNVPLPPTGVNDWSPYAQRIKELDADAVIVIHNVPSLTGLIRAAASLGINDVKWGYQASGIADVDASAIAEEAWPNLVFAGGLPTPNDEATFPDIAQFLSDMSGNDFPREEWRADAIGAWQALQAFKAIAERVKGDVTSASVLKELQTAKDVDVNGLLQQWTPEADGSADLAPRLSQAIFYEQKIENGKLVAASDKQWDLYELIGTESD